MVRATWVLAGVVGVMGMLASGCVRSNAVSCGGGLFCPEGSQCDDFGRCIQPDQLAACAELLDEDTCTIETKKGTCRNGACELWACGDTYLNGNDSCDGDELGGATCKDAGFYDAPGLACTPLCTFDTQACGGGFCGDKEINGPELCDGPTNKTCISIGFDGGTVGCDRTCGLTITDCSRFGWNPEALIGVVALAVGGVSATDHWAVGANGRANHFVAPFWNVVSTGVTNNLIAVWGIAPDNVWAVGQGQSSSQPALLLQYTGTPTPSWQRVMGTPAGADFVDIWAAGASAVFAATSASGIQKFDGTAWTEVGALSKKAIAIRGSAADDIWVATETDLLHGELMHWDGAAWAPSTLPNAKIRFLDVNSKRDVWAIGHDTTSLSNGVIAHYDGTTWTTWRTPGEIYNNIASSAPNDTWVAGSDGQMRHFDGVGWISTNSIGASPSGLAAISGLISFGPSEVVAVSTLNLAYRYRGQAFGRFPNLPYPDPFAASVNTAMWGTSSTNMWVVTVKGEVLHYDAQGPTPWKLSLTIDPSQNVGATSIWGSSNTDIWVSTQDGRVFQFNGTTWTAHDVSPAIPLQKVWGSGPNDVWAFGSAGAFHYTGSTWTRYLLSNTLVYGAAGSGPGDIYVVTLPDVDGDALWHWNGADWTPAERTGMAAFVPTTKINNVIAIASNLVFVVANNGHIHRFDGMTWTDDVIEATAELKFLSGSADDDVIAASERELFHWDGRQWSAMRPPVDFVPNTMDYLPMADLLVSPGRIDMLLQRFRIRTLIRTRPLRCREDESSCSDAVDNDCNGFLDRSDSECPQN